MLRRSNDAETKIKHLEGLVMNQQTQSAANPNSKDKHISGLGNYKGLDQFTGRSKELRPFVTPSMP